LVHAPNYDTVAARAVGQHLRPVNSLLLAAMDQTCLIRGAGALPAGSAVEAACSWHGRIHSARPQARLSRSAKRRLDLSDKRCAAGSCVLRLHDLNHATGASTHEPGWLRPPAAHAAAGQLMATWARRLCCPVRPSDRHADSGLEIVRRFTCPASYQCSAVDNRLLNSSSAPDTQRPFAAVISR
jgi:hypothetical protein